MCGRRRARPPRSWPAACPEGGVAACEEQTAGRGRRGREWTSPRGAGVLFSLSLHPETPPGRLPPLTLVVAEAVAEAAWPEAAVRWPNDVVVDGHKLAGILAEVRDGEVVVGIGVNANHELGDLPADARVAPTSLRLLSGGTVDRAAAPGRHPRGDRAPVPGVRARRLLGPRTRRPARPPGEPRRRRRGDLRRRGRRGPPGRRRRRAHRRRGRARSTSAVEEGVSGVDRRRPRERVADAHPGRRGRGVPACERVAVRGALHRAGPARHGRA